jgi:hypothetical protein
MAEFRPFRSLCICLAGLLSSAVLGPGFGNTAVIIVLKVGRDPCRCVESNIDR